MSLPSWIFEKSGWLAFSFAALALAWFLKPQRRARGFADLPLPPGPKPLPIVGNAFAMPSVQPWLTYNSWSKIYGDVMFLHLPQQPTVILGSAEAALDLLDKRPIYADRPVTIMDNLMRWDWNLGLMPYSPYWRKVRRPLHHHFHKGVVQQHQIAQVSEVRALLRRLLVPQKSTGKNIRQLTAAIILRITYGLEILDMYDEYVSMAEKAVEGLSLSKIPGAFWIEYLPFLRYIPTWTPGAQFHKFASEYRPFVEEMRRRPFEAVKTSLANGTATPSMAYTMIQQLQQYKGTNLLRQQEEIAMDATGIAYAAAADTTTSALTSFLLAMVMYPDIQRKAQDELDKQIGPSRLPEFEDLQSLTYLTAVLLETIRWQPVAPLGVPRRASADDEYKGYHIPKGSIVMANVWGILHDPEEYPDPEKFNPDRFIKDGQLSTEVRDPTQIAFGFGRRICVGKHHAVGTMSMTMASILHAFNIETARDEQGKFIAVMPDMGSGLVSHPTDIQLIFTPRSVVVERLIRESDL